MHPRKTNVTFKWNPTTQTCQHPLVKVKSTLLVDPAGQKPNTSTLTWFKVNANHRGMTLTSNRRGCVAGWRPGRSLASRRPGRRRTTRRTVPHGVSAGQRAPRPERVDLGCRGATPFGFPARSRLHKQKCGCGATTIGSLPRVHDVMNALEATPHLRSPGQPNRL